MLSDLMCCTAADIETKDVEAKQKMTNLRVSWSAAEDSLVRNFFNYT